jgi:hypothetical protein
MRQIQRDLLRAAAAGALFVLKSSANVEFFNAPRRVRRRHADRDALGEWHGLESACVVFSALQRAA